jgi:phage terminase small subunit
MKNKTGKLGTSKASATHRKAVFVEAYIENAGNATRAAIAAGYSVRTADRQGSRLLKDVEVSKALATRRAELIVQHQLTTERVIGALQPLCFSDIRRLFRENGTLKHPCEWDANTASAVASIEVVETTIGYDKSGKPIPGLLKRIKFWDKNAALEKAMKHLGLFERDNKQIGEAARLICVPQKRRQ